MASINYGAKEISVKIVYYGPGKSGKTTNLQVIHQKSPASNKSDMVSLATEKDRTIFFDFLPLSLGKVRGFDTKFQLYTVPGQVFYNSTRKLVLRGVDGVVFVADSAPDKQDENLESFHNLIENLKEHGYDFDTIPTILQYNKRDLPTAVDLATLDNALNTRGLSRTEAVAVKGTGVFETLKLIGKEVISALNTKYGTTGMHPLPRTGSLSRDAQTQQKPSAASPSQPRDAQAAPRQQQPPQQPASQPQPHAAPQQPAPQKPQPQEPPQQPRPQQPEQQPQQQSQSSAQAAEQRLSSPIEEATGTPQQPAAQSPHQPPEKPAEAPAGEQAPSAGPAAGQSQPAQDASDLSADADTYVDENSFEYPQDTSELDLEIQRYQREIEENKWKKNVDAAGTSKDTPPQPNAPATSGPSGETDTPRHPEAPPSASPQQPSQQPSQQHPEEESASFEITDTNELVAQTQQSNTGTQSPGEKETEQPDEEDDSFDEEQTYYFTTSKKKRKSKGLFGRLFGK